MHRCQSQEMRQELGYSLFTVGDQQTGAEHRGFLCSSVMTGRSLEAGKASLASPGPVGRLWSRHGLPGLWLIAVLTPTSAQGFEAHDPEDRDDNCQNLTQAQRG